jgi:deoxyribodipyrimidine photo-lyase
MRSFADVQNAPTTIHWFRQDLRLADNLAVAAACASHGRVLPVYIYAPAEEADWPPGGAQRWWLHHSLKALSQDLHHCHSRLILRASDNSLNALRQLIEESGAQRIVWNRRYEPAAITRDQRIKAALRAQGIDVTSYNSNLLHEPWTVATKSATPFQVFTPFWRQCLALPAPDAAIAAPARIKAPSHWPESLPIDRLDLLPHQPWDSGFYGHWTPGAEGAQALLRRFLSDAALEYTQARNRPDLPGTSRLSPHLHFGEIGPRQIWHAVREAAIGAGQHTSWRNSSFLTELGWREFAYHLLFHFPDTSHSPLRKNFSRFAWREDAAALTAWQRGRTGYPIVDAGMRQLWHTGWMHNRVRMIVASFLVKDLLLPWQRGAQWFWDTLVDADLASNTLGWQWVAGCGADAAPYFRVFNPVLQGQKFDPNGDYVRRWVPELAALENGYVHRPWEAPAEVLRAAAICLGENYPQPIVDHTAARQRALAALKASASDRDEK